MTNKWVEKPYDALKAEKLQKNTDLTSFTSRLLVSRGIETAEDAKSFLRPNFATDLHNPSLLADIDKVVARIYKAIQKKETILFHGDYDADGVTTTAIFVKGLREVGANIDFFVPNRFKDGYGVNKNNVEKFAKYDLIITGDTGIKAFDAIYELTHTYETDVIVTDHHEPVVFELKDKHRIPDKTKVIENEDEIMALPDAFAVINPKRIDCAYPGKDLSGAGVAFKVVEALYDYLHYPKRNLYQMLDLVACGLVPDMVPMFNVQEGTFEVRNLVKLGLSIMNNNPKPWVSSVLHKKNEKKKNKSTKITSTDLGFVYGPLLNATGRLYDPTPAAEFLMEDNESVCMERIEYLYKVNEERKKLSAENTNDILKVLKDQDEEFVDYGIVVTSPSLHVGITGLVAGNVLNEYYRTTIALAPFKQPDGAEVLKGSARSIYGISVLDALIDVEAEMGSYVYGGHEQAAGLTLTLDQLEPFRKAFRLAVKKQAEKLGPEVFEPKKFYDAHVHFEDIDFKLIDELGQFEPYGMGNEEPIFYAKNVIIDKLNVYRDAETKKEKAIKFTFVQDGFSIDGIAFNKLKDIEAQYEEALRNNSEVPCELLGYPQANEWNGRVTFQFVVKEIKF